MEQAPQGKLMRRALIILATLLFALPAWAGDITSNLTLWWKMDDGSGTSVTDSSGNGYTGTFVNSPTWITGKFGGGLSFNDDGSVSRADNNAFSFGNGTTDQPFTVAAWVTFDDNTSQCNILGKFVATADREWRFVRFSDGKLNLVLYDESADTQINREGTKTTWTAGTWYHVAVTYQGSKDGSNVHFYVNGSEDAQTDNNDVPVYGGMENLTGALVAAGFNGSNVCKGDLDEVRLYARELTAADITDLYNYAPASGTNTRRSLLGVGK